MAFISRRTGIVAVLVVLLLAPFARASFHDWRISEVYSDASGTAQAIELHESFGGTAEYFLGGFTISSNSHTYTFPSNLPAVNTANRYFIIGTPAFAALSGAPALDYTLPAGNFFNSAGDVINYASGTDVFNFGAIPTDGNNSVHRAGQFTFNVTIGPNDPTNFSGTVGHVPEPGVVTLFVLCGCGALFRRRAY
jgi:hypothetical protein